MEIKSLKKETTSFKANGKTYYLKGLTIGRLKEFRKLERHFAWGQSFESDYKEMETIEKYLNKQDWVSAAVTVRNRRDRIQYFEQDREEPALLMCTLFFSLKDEDLSVWSIEDARRKIEDWNKEGYSYQDFFFLAAKLVPGVVERLNETSLLILQGAVQQAVRDSIEK